MLLCTVFAVLPIIALRCSTPPLPGEMPVSYLKDAEQTEPWTLPLARALLIDILTIWNGFYGYLLYFKCMFALVSKQVCECNRVWLAGGARGWKMTSGTGWFDFLFFLLVAASHVRPFHVLRVAVCLRLAWWQYPLYSCCPRGEFSRVRLMLRSTAVVSQQTAHTQQPFSERHPG